MKVLLFLLLCVGAALGQSPITPRTVESRSKQFTVRAGRAFDAFVPRVSDGRTIDLDPTLVAVSAERIKSLLLRELGLADSRTFAYQSGEGKIYILLQEARSPQVFAEAIKTPAGWSYRLEVPRQIEPPRLVEAIVATLLLDLANRGNSGASPQLPEWLKRGMTEHLQARSMEGLILQQDLRTTKVQVKVDPLAGPREIFAKNRPLSFEEISWPEHLDPEKAELFSPSSQLLVHYLLEQKHGRTAMTHFLGLLKHRRNWQTALFESYSEWRSPVDIEKWWAVTIVQFTAIDPAFAWPRPAALQHMENALRVPVQVHSASESLPVNSTTDLSRVFLSWDNLQQEVGLQTAHRQLRALRPRLPADLVDLNDQYCAAIESYLSQQAARNLGSRTLANNSASQRKRSARKILELNARFEELKQMPIASARDEAIQRALNSAQGIP